MSKKEGFSCKFLGRTIPVLFVDEAYANNNMGRYNQGRDTIHLNDALPPDLTRQVFLHEATHLIYDAFSLQKEDDPERVVESISSGMYAILQEPEIKEFLFSEN